MTTNFQVADSRVLHEPFAKELATNGPNAALSWLTGVLASQSPSLRSSNSFLVAYTGCPEAIDWLEVNVASPVSSHWGEGAALLGTPWSRIKDWIAVGGARQLMAFDTLLAYRAPAPNMAPLAQIAAPVLPEAPTEKELEATLASILGAQSSPRIRKNIESLLTKATEIIGRKDRRVSVQDLPLLYLQPELFPSAQEILGRHDAVVSGMRQSVQNLIKELPPRQ